MKKSFFFSSFSVTWKYLSLLCVAITRRDEADITRGWESEPLHYWHIKHAAIQALLFPVCDFFFSFLAIVRPVTFAHCSSRRFVRHLYWKNVFVPIPGESKRDRRQGARVTLQENGPTQSLMMQLHRLPKLLLLLSFFFSLSLLFPRRWLEDSRVLLLPRFYTKADSPCILSTLYTKEEELGGRPWCLFLSSSIYINTAQGYSFLEREREREDLRWLWLNDGCLKRIPIIRLPTRGSLRWVKKKEKEMGRMSLHHLNCREIPPCLPNGYLYAKLMV